MAWIAGAARTARTVNLGLALPVNEKSTFSQALVVINSAVYWRRFHASTDASTLRM